MSIQVPPGAPTSVSAEKSALNKVMWFGIIELAGLVAGWVEYFYTFGNFFLSFSNLNLPPNPTPSQISAVFGSLFQGLTVFIAVSFVIQLAAIITLIIGLRGFSSIDHPRFSVPSKLVYLLVIGDVIAVAAVVPLFNSIPNLLAQIPLTPGATPSSAFLSSLSNLLLYLLIILLAGILALIGLIGGQILGLWRVGSRYNETTIKLGAIFVIIPLLNIVAPILVLVGVNDAKRRLPV